MGGLLLELEQELQVLANLGKSNKSVIVCLCNSSLGFDLRLAIELAGDLTFHSMLPGLANTRVKSDPLAIKCLISSCLQASAFTFSGI